MKGYSIEIMQPDSQPEDIKKILRHYNEEWNQARKDAIRDYQNVEKMARLCSAPYLLVIRGTPPKEEADWRPLFYPLAKVFHEAFRRLEDDQLNHIHDSLVDKGKYFDHPSHEIFTVVRDQAQDILDLAEGGGKTSPLLEILLIGHDLEAYVLPNLARLHWAAKTSTGSKNNYESYLITPEGKKGSIIHSLNGISDWIRTQIKSDSSFVEPMELEFLMVNSVESMRHVGKQEFALDRLRNSIAHRDFRIDSDGVTINWHPFGSERIMYTFEELTKLRKMIMWYSYCIYGGIQEVFMAHVHGRRSLPYKSV